MPPDAKIAVLYQADDRVRCEGLAARLAVPLLPYSRRDSSDFTFFLAFQQNRLCLLKGTAKTGIAVEFDVRSEMQRSWPAPKKGPLAQAIGHKTRTVVDATAGWGQDSFLVFRMGYDVLCLERHPVMAALLGDGLRRLGEQNWMSHLQLSPPGLLPGDAIERLTHLDFIPDCIYLDPMFPEKPKKSALTKKTMTLLRDLVGGDEDRQQLFSVALQAAGKRVVVKSPDYAPPLRDKNRVSFTGKLLRYDVYFK